MEITSAQVSGWIGAFFWPLLRIGTMFMVMPVFSGRSLSARFRLVLALVVTYVIAITLPPMPAVEVMSGEGLVITVQQVLIGLFMGFSMQLVFSAVSFGGQMVAYSMGLGFANMMDPSSGVQVPVVAQYFIILVTLLFLVMDAHLILIETVASSFVTMPVAVDGLVRSDFWTLASWAAQIFAGGLLMSMPAVIALLMVNLTFGVVTRAAPQLNIFAVGFPVTMLLGFGILWATLPSVIGFFNELLDGNFQMMRSVLSGP